MFPGPRRGRDRCRLESGSRIAEVAVQSVGPARPSAGHSFSPPRLRRFAFPFNESNAREDEKLGVIFVLPNDEASAKGNFGGLGGRASLFWNDAAVALVYKKTPGTLTVFP